MIQLFLLIFSLLNHEVDALSSPSVNPSNPNFQTGLTSIISSGSLGTTNQTFPFTLANAMSNSSIKAALGIAVNEMTLTGTSMGFDLYIVSVSATQMFVAAFATDATNPITKLKICYLVTSYAQLHVNYYTYVFNSMTDSVLNSGLTDSTVCPNIGTISNTLECRSTSISMSYPAIGNTKKVIALISGFVVNSFRNGMGSNPSFGLGFFNQNPQASSVTLDVIVFGRMQLSSVSSYYINYELQSLNIYADKVIISGSSSVGCSINWGTLCQVSDPANVNTTITTSSTGFNSFYASNYFYGFSSYIGGYDGSSAYGMNFAVGATTLSGTAYQSGFSYTGNGDGKFRMVFHYLIILEFYCPDSGTSDIYYVYNSNSCNSTCNNWLMQYADVSRKCQLCDAVCFKCVGSPSTCTDCYVAHNRIISGNRCICNTIGYYDDGTSLTCPSCHYSCLSCTGPSASQCIDCLSTSKRTIDINSCFCNPRFYDNGVNQVCPSCHYTCYTCSGSSATNCLTCAPSDFRTVLSSNNSCPCMVGYYDRGSPNTVCGTCHYTCLTCTNTGSTACSTCDSTFQFRNQTGTTCPCMTGYYDNLSPVCALCHVTCQKCNGPLRVDCTSCDSLKQRSLESGQCKCKAQFYEYNVTCYPCHYSCYNCTGGTKNQCTTCNSGVTFRNFNTSDSSCYCIPGYFDAGPSVAVCTKCDRTCLTCQNSSTTCLTCDGTKNREPAGTSCPCKFGFVDTMLVSGYCTKCHYSCLTCSGVSSTQCSTCDTTWRSLTGGSCLCKTRTYDDGIHSQCYPCNQECVDCTDQYETTCKTCDSSLMRELVGTYPKPCTCMQRYFENNNVLLCEPCHYSCLTCSVISTNCTSCDSATNHRYPSATTCPCETHYYDNGAQTCALCSPTCQNCTVAPNNCTSCYTDRYLLNNNCLCNLGTYEDLFLTCQPCHYSCRSCQNSSTTCLSCPVFTYRSLLNATCPCNFGYYDNNAAVCTACPYQCSGCTGPSPPQCIACPPSSFRTLQPDKSCPCNTGYYDDGTSPICKICSSTCASCTSFSVCTSCFPSATQFRTLLSNSCKCIAGYYDNLVNPVCQPCHYSCATCFGGLDTNCFSCKPNRSFQVGTSSCPCQNGFYESSQVCYACDTSCKTCFGVATNCTGCDTAIRYLQSNKCLCRDGTYENGGVCSACNVACGSCNLSSINCLSCNSTHLTVLSGASCVCLPGQYQNSTTLVCTACDVRCATCSGAGQFSCLSCNATSLRTYNTITHACDCNSGYIDTGAALCSLCHPSCLTCYGPTETNCLSCYPGATKLGSTCKIQTSCSSGYNYEGYCVTVCPNSTYPSVNVCLTCINNCKTCLSSSLCTSCVEGYFFNTTSQTCTINCLQGSYMNKVTRTCDLCPVGCQLCVQRNSSVVCQKCQLNFYMLNHTRCVDGVYCSVPNFVIVGLMCFACQHPCKTCNSIAYNGCLSCVDGFSLFGGECLTTCPLGYYSFNRTCLQCSSRCKQCSATKCELCNDAYYLTPDSQNPKCITNGYFYNPQTGQQQKCHPNCMSCTNSSFSSCISCSKFRGDPSQMAVSGYCQCWQDSIDIGEGKCSFDSLQQIKTYTKVLTSSTDSALYAGAVASVFSGNFISTFTFIIYQQSYSVLYFVNSSSLLQTGHYLEQALDKNLNFYLNSRLSIASNTNSTIIHYSRLLVTLQNDMSLFGRGNHLEIYLFSWAFYTAVAIGALWMLIFVINCLLKCKCVTQNQAQKTIFMTAKNILQEPALIIVHLLTVSEISLYSTVTFKFIVQNFSTLEIDWAKLSLSALLSTYYLVYILRLIIGACCIGKSSNFEAKYQYNPLRFLVFGFEEIQLQSDTPKLNSHRLKFADVPLMKKLFIPFLMIRMASSSISVVFLSYNPLYQVGSLIGIMALWTIYSLIYCPYDRFFKIFIHLNELTYIAQIGMLMYSVLNQDGSQLLPAYIQLILNGVQVGTMILFSILMGVRMVFGICRSSKIQNSNRVGNIYFSHNQNNNSELYLNEGKEEEVNDEIKPYRLHDVTSHQQLLDETQNDQNNKKNKENSKLDHEFIDRKNNQHPNEVNIEQISVQDQEVYDKQGQDSEQFENVIIKKKYRAVKKMKN